MPALSVSIDGVMIATVCTDGYDVLNIRASGTCIDDHLSGLEIAGGSYPENGDQTYLTWVNELPLQPIKLSPYPSLSTHHRVTLGKQLKSYSRMKRQ
jgi:hypothetical protein